MSLAIPSPSVSTPATLDPKRDWTTPEEQLNRLISSIATEISESSPLFPDLARVVAVYMIEEEGDWYIALERLKSRLPEKIKIPPLPSNIYDILHSKSLIHGDPGDDDTPSIIDTHHLSLVLEEFGCLGNLQRNILIPYAQEAYAGKGNPLRFDYCRNCDQYLAAAFPKTHWILTSELPGSANWNWDVQRRLVESLKTLANYEVASLQQIFVANSTQVVATGKTISDMSIRTQEVTGQLLTVSCHAFGISCTAIMDLKSEQAGIVVARKL
jgi:hypothetical protein